MLTGTENSVASYYQGEVSLTNISQSYVEESLLSPGRSWYIKLQNIYIQVDVGGGGHKWSREIR